MNAVRRAFRVLALVAIHAAAAIVSTCLARADSLLNHAEWRAGDRWIVHADAQRASLAAPDWEVPASPLLPDVVTPKDTIGAPIECKIEITLTLLRKVRRVNNRVMRLRHSKEFAHHGSAPSHKSRSCTPAGADR
jgi:hypothetical protein